ncbi:MAG: tetratricopeptide repeat protein [Chloroflexota bacterium]
MEPRDPNLTLALHFVETGQPQRALTHLDRANADQTDNPFFWYVRGQALYDLEEFDSAIQAVHKGLTLAPEAIFLLYQLCNCQSRQGNLAAAERTLLKALQQAPEDPELLCRYAILVSEGGQLDKAEQLVEEAARFDPEHPAIARTQATLAYLTGHDRQAAEASRRTLLSNPDDIYGQYMLGVSLAAEGRVGDADVYLRTAARLDPLNEAITSTTRHSRLIAHWLLWPLRPVQRFGPMKIWLAAIVVIFGLWELGFAKLTTTLATVYLVYCVYSWVAPPLLKWWLQRQRPGYR